VELCELASVSELRQCEGVQISVWGENTPEVTTATFRAAVHAGALVAGAFEGGELLGFAFGFPSYVDARVGFHAHLLAVLPQARGRGVGRALKWFQRDWCLARGLERVTWTFDPLQARNAKLNLEHLGAYARHYLPDFYGPLGGSLNGDLPSDRLLAEWLLNAPHVAALAAGETRPAASKPSVAALVKNAAGEPEPRDISRVGERVWLELPAAIAPQSDSKYALRWRLALRGAMRPLVEEGFRATRFVAGGYVLEKP
jgi:chorismate synthase